MTPQVTTGYRAPTQEGRMRAGQVFQGPERIPEGKTVIKFNARKYRLELVPTMVKDYPDGRKEVVRGIHITADDGFKFLDNETDKRAIELLKAHPYYGTDFVDFAEELASRQAKKEAEVLSVLSDPDARKRIIEALKATGESFELPKAKEPEKTGAGASK
jgi:hypothetical protein